MELKKFVFVSVLAFVCQLASTVTKAQYVQPERDDTIRLMPKAPFDTLEARKALAKGTGTIKGVAFSRPTDQGFGIKTGKKIMANKIKIILMPVTPYLLEFLDLKKKQNAKKLKFAYLSQQCWYYRLEAITNSDGEFTFPEMKPGKYYLEGMLNWSRTMGYDKYTGSGYNGYGQTDYYSRQYYNEGHADLLTKFVEIKEDHEVVEVKLKP